MLDWASEQSLGFSHFVSVGNMLDVDLADLLDYLAADTSTDAVILYVESVDERPAIHVGGPCLLPAKPIVAYKAGRFPQSAQAAASHTGAMAGVDSVYEAAFERAGIVRIFECGRLVRLRELLARGPRLRGERLAIVTNAGGPGVMACDALLARDGKLAQAFRRHGAAARRVAAGVLVARKPGRHARRRDARALRRALEIVAADREVDAVLAILTPQAMTDPTATATAVVDMARRAHKPILANWMGGRLVREGIEILNKAGVPTAVYARTTRCAAFMHLVRYGGTWNCCTRRLARCPWTSAASGRQVCTNR